MVAPVLVKPGGKRQLWGDVFLTFSASQPRCRISRLPAMPVFPSCSLTSAITLASRSLTLEWMALNQAWAVAESLLLKITVCLASGEWISSCLEKQREGLEGFLADHASSSPRPRRWTHSLLLLLDCQFCIVHLNGPIIHWLTHSFILLQIFAEDPVIGQGAGGIVIQPPYHLN